MYKISTILGDIPANLLGFCQCHEHLMIRKGFSCEVVPSLCIDQPAKSKQELLAYRDAGGNALIDAQPLGCNRMELELAQLSLESGIHILASTGFHKLCFYPKHHWIFTMTSKQLEELFIHEINIGMFTDCDNTLPNMYRNFKASIIKTAIDTAGLTSPYKKLFCAAIAASLKTKTPMMVHIEKDADPIALLNYLLSQGMDPEFLIFCHMDRACKNIALHKEVLSKGVYLEFDTIGRFKYHSNEKELEIIKELLEGGFENQLLFSLDTTNERLRSYCSGAVGLDYILITFIPLMLENGITTTQIHKFFYENCIRILSHQAN